MAPVQTAHAAGNTASLALTFAAAATAGNLLVVGCASDATVATPAGWTLAVADVNVMGCYLFFKVAAGGETAVSLVPSVTDNIGAAMAEYAGTTATPLDVTAHTGTTGSSGSTIGTGTTAATAQATELVVVVYGVHNSSGVAPVSWATATQRDGAFVGTGGTASGAYIGDYTTTSTGTQTDAATSTGTAFDRTGLIATFKLSAAVAIASIPQPARARRPGLPPPIRRSRTTGPVPAQVAVPPPAWPSSTPPRKALERWGALARRGRQWLPPWGQAVVRDLVLTATQAGSRWTTTQAGARWSMGGTPVQRMSTLSTEYVRVKVAATVNGAAINPTSDAVQFAFTLDGANPTSWVSGSWETDATGQVAIYYARTLVGPSGGTVLAAGTWTVWLKVTDSPETPVRQVGVLIVS
jgi:hypothetical protein